MNHEIRIETTFNSDEIRQTMHGHGCVQDQIIQSVIKLKDEGVRKALIELGWTPPVATPVPDYAGEGSAWTPPNLESRLVPELTEEDLVRAGRPYCINDREPFERGARWAEAFIREHVRSIPADRVLGEGMVAVDRDEIELLRLLRDRAADAAPYGELRGITRDALRANQGGAAR